MTDDPEPVDLHHWEVYIACQRTDTPAGRNGALPHVEVNNGFASNLQVHVIMPYAFQKAPGQPEQRGYGDTEFGIKYRFIQEARKRPMVGVFPLVEIPTGSARRGLGTGHWPVFLPVWLQKSWEPWTTYGGGGYWINPGPGNRDYWLAGWVVQKDLSERLTLGGELYYTTPSVEGGRRQWSFNLGGQYNVDEGHHILFSAGRGDRDTTFTAYLAHQWTFGP